MHWPLSVVRGLTDMGGRWTVHDRLLQAAYRHHRQAICDGCGGYLDETTDASRYSGPHRTHQVDVEKAVKCWHCAAISDYRSSDKVKSEKHPNLLRVLTRVVRLGSGSASGGA